MFPLLVVVATLSAEYYNLAQTAAIIFFYFDAGKKRLETFWLKFCFFWLKIRFSRTRKTPQKSEYVEEEARRRRRLASLPLPSSSSFSSPSLCLLLPLLRLRMRLSEKTTTSLSFVSSSSASSLDGIPVSNTSGRDSTRVSQISWQPNAVKYEKFLSNSECDYLIENVFVFFFRQSRRRTRRRSGRERLNEVARNGRTCRLRTGKIRRVYKHDLNERDEFETARRIRAVRARENVGRINDMHLARWF